MAAGYKSTIDHTIQLANEWVHQIDELMPWNDSNKSFRLLRAVLHTVRDMLGVEEAAQLAAQLPLFIRGVYFDGWNPSVTPAALREKPDFVARIIEGFAPDLLEEPESLISHVLSVINTRVSPGEMRDVRGSMRKSVRDIWPEPKG
jgi:uncharacterized protein (DUF2267 family)